MTVGTKKYNKSQNDMERSYSGWKSRRPDMESCYEYVE
jgi:hypothetical protein